MMTVAPHSEDNAIDGDVPVSTAVARRRWDFLKTADNTWMLTNYAKVT